jgi:hypothetical protein
MSSERDIITVVAELTIGFEALNLPRPEAIVLKTHEDGMSVLCAVMARSEPYMLYSPGKEPGIRPVEGENGVTYMEIEVYGMKIRWPAKRFAIESGGWRFG